MTVKKEKEWLEWFLQWLNRFERTKPTLIKGEKRKACVAIILRLHNVYNDEINEKTTRILPSKLNDIKAVKELIEHLKTNGKEEEFQVEILFIKRATRETDRWSGQVAFPGGKKEQQDKYDISTATRETREEISLDLDNKEHFAYIGRLDDKQATKHMTVSPFVFFQLIGKTPPLHLQISEVASIVWVPFSFFLSIPQERLGQIVWNVEKSGFPSYFRAFGIQNLYFSSIFLPRSVEKTFSEPLLRNVVEEELPNNLNNFELWGLTLRITKNLLSISSPPSTLSGHHSIHSLNAFVTKNSIMDFVIIRFNQLSAYSTLTLFILSAFTAILLAMILFPMFINNA